MCARSGGVLGIVCVCIWVYGNVYLHLCGFMCSSSAEGDVRVSDFECLPEMPAHNDLLYL